MQNISANLGQKLGLNKISQAYCYNAPAEYLDYLPSLTAIDNLKSVSDAEWLQAFYIDRLSLDKDIEVLKGHLAARGQLWLSWPKKSSGVKSDLTDNVVRRIGIEAGLVDIKVCSIDNVWSGLKFVQKNSKLG